MNPFSSRSPILGRTANCVMCSKPAMSFTAHVTRADGDIIAGWCDEHEGAADNLQSPRVGEWKPEMGLNAFTIGGTTFGGSR